MSSLDKLNDQDFKAARGRVSAGKAEAGALKFFTVNDVAEVLSVLARRQPRPGDHGPPLLCNGSANSGGPRGAPL